MKISKNSRRENNEPDGGNGQTNARIKRTEVEKKKNSRMKILHVYEENESGGREEETFLLWIGRGELVARISSCGAT